MTEGTDGVSNILVNGTCDKQLHSGTEKDGFGDAERSKATEKIAGSKVTACVNGDTGSGQDKETVSDQRDPSQSSTKSRLKEIDKKGPDSNQESMGCNNTRTVMEPTKKMTEKESKDVKTGDMLKAVPSESVPEVDGQQIPTSSSDNVFCDQTVSGQGGINQTVESSDSGMNRSRNTSRTSESTNSDTEKAVVPSESASESTEKVVTQEAEASSDVTDIEETPDDGNVESSSFESGSQNRPHSLSLPKPLQYYERHRHKVLKGAAAEDTSSDDQISVDSDISSLGSSLQGTITRKGDMIEFVAENLQEKIRGSKDSSSMGSRTSSMRSISSVNSISSYTSSLATSVSGMSRSPSSLVQQSPDAIPPIDPQAVQDLEYQARIVADRVDLMMGNLKANLFKMSAITVGTLDAYKHSVESTCEAVDASIKAMYALMAKCEELSSTVQPVYQLADQIKEIKRLLDLFENRLDAKTS